MPPDFVTHELPFLVPVGPQVSCRFCPPGLFLRSPFFLSTSSYLPYDRDSMRSALNERCVTIRCFPSRGHSLS